METTKNPPLQSRIEQAAKMRLAKQAKKIPERIKNIRMGQTVAYWIAGNRRGKNPVPMTVQSAHSHGSLKLVGVDIRGNVAVPIMCDGAVHWKDKLFDDFPAREATTATWAFIDELTNK